MSELIAMPEVCEYFVCSEARIIEMLRGGELPGVKFGRSWAIPRQAFWQRVNELALQEAEERRIENRAPLPAHLEPGVPMKRPRGRPRKHLMPPTC
jgi:excisionase family DNA binding protein